MDVNSVSFQMFLILWSFISLGPESQILFDFFVLFLFLFCFVLLFVFFVCFFRGGGGGVGRWERAQ